MARPSGGLAQDYRELPPILVDIGRRAYGDVGKFTDVISRVEPPVQIRAAAHRSLRGIRLVQPPGDTSAQKIVELEKQIGDSYGLKEIMRKQRGRRISHQELEVAVDIGANIGYFTIILCKMLPRAVVLSLEASPTTYFFLRWNLHLNNITNHPLEAWQPGMASSSPLAGGVIALNRVASQKGSSGTYTVSQRADYSESQLAFAVRDEVMTPRRVLGLCGRLVKRNGTQRRTLGWRACADVHGRQSSGTPVTRTEHDLARESHRHLPSTTRDLASFARDHVHVSTRDAGVATTSSSTEHAVRMVTHHVPALDVLGLIIKQHIASMRFVKIDCEGCEYAMLAAWHAAGWFPDANRSRIELLGMELHALDEQIQSRLDPAHVNSVEFHLQQRGCFNLGWFQMRRTKMLRC